MRFTIRALDKGHAINDIEIEAIDRDELDQKIRELSIVPLLIHELQLPTPGLGLLNILSWFITREAERADLK